MTGKRAEQAARSRARIVAAAERLFARDGYDGTSLQAIADAAGVGKANVYHYFRTKAEILDEALVGAVAAVHELLAGAARLPRGEARARFIVDGYVELLVSRRHRQPWGRIGDDQWRGRAVAAAIERLTDQAASMVFDGPRTLAQRLLIHELLALSEALPKLAAADDDELRVLLHGACDALLSIPGALSPGGAALPHVQRLP